MGWFSSDEKSTLATHPVNIDVTTKSGSAAEQDRYAQHFSSDAIRRGVDRGLDKLQNAANAAGSGAEQDRYASHLSVGDRIHRAIREAARYQGDGAEQDRYNAHFSPALHSADSVKALKAAGSVVANGEKNASWFGLGYDGQQRAKLMAGSGMGAEQDRLGSHFGLSKDSVVNAAQRVKEGAQDVLSRR